MSGANRLVGAFGRFALIGRWSKRRGVNVFRRRTRRRPRRRGSSSAASILRDKWREESDRRNLETAGLIFTVKFIGLDVVADAYDEAGCQRALRKCGRRIGYKQSSPVLLSLSSTSVQIIQLQWVVAFEHAVTAVSTCYTDLHRPRLFAYIVKDYMTGKHLCLAFKTMNKSGVTGKRLQRVFGYAFDSCVPCTPSSERSLELSELEKCLQISSYSRSWRGLLRSNSNFSAVPETGSPGELPHTDSTTVYTPSNTAVTHTQNKQTCSRSRADEASRNSDLKTSPVVNDYEERRESSGAKLSKNITGGKQCCCHCHRELRRRITRSLSDGFLRVTYQSVRQPTKPGLSPVINAVSGRSELSVHRTEFLDKERDVRQDESGKVDAECIAGVGTCSMYQLESDAEYFHEKALISVASNTSDDIVVLLPSTLPKRLTEDELCTVDMPVSTHMYPQQIERQVGYVNLPTHMSCANSLSPIPTAFKSTGFDTHSRSSETNSQNDNFLQVKQEPSTCKWSKAITSSGFISDTFLNELTLKLTQLAKTSKSTCDHDRPTSEELAIDRTSRMNVSQGTQQEGKPPTPPPRRESLHCDEAESHSFSMQEPSIATRLGHNLSAGMSPANTSDDTNHRSTCTLQSVHPMSTSVSTTGVTTPNYSPPTLPSQSPRRAYTYSPQQNVAKSIAIANANSSSPTANAMCPPCPPNRDTCTTARKTDTTIITSSTNIHPLSTSMVDHDSFVSGSCSQGLSSQEVQKRISQMLNLVCLPPQGSSDAGVDVGSGMRTLTCLVATWEQKS